MTRIATVLAALVAATPAAAQEPPPPMPVEFFADRRQALMERIAATIEPGEEHIVVLRGAPARADLEVFYQDQGFYYLSGVTEPDLVMVLFPADGTDLLLVPPFSPFTAKWDGARLAPGDAAAERTGFAEVGNSRSLQRRLRSWLEERESAVVWTFGSPQPGRTATASSATRAEQSRDGDVFDARPSREAAFGAAMEERFDGVEVRDVTGLVSDLRAVKQPAEIAAIRAATEIAAEGHAEAMRTVRPGMFEFQVAAVARYVFSRMGAGADAYAAIVGAGANGCILHYNANAKRIEDGDLIVMDYGPTVNGYCTDVTRTFPANGVFTPAQRKLVEDVLDVQRALIARVRPGERLTALGAACRRLLRDKGYRADHGPCHHVGLAVHDERGDVLMPGMVITVEPGAYLEEEGMGCRIEDVVLVTEDGCEVLSGHLPASPDAIEALMKGDGVHQSPVGLRGR